MKTILTLLLTVFCLSVIAQTKQDSLIQVELKKGLVLRTDTLSATVLYFNDDNYLKKGECVKVITGYGSLLIEGYYSAYIGERYFIAGREIKKENLFQMLTDWK